MIRSPCPATVMGSFNKYRRCRRATTSFLRLSLSIRHERFNVLTRLHLIVTLPPPDAVGTVYCRSSPRSVKGRFCSTPFQFGNVALSISNTRELSRIEYVPKCAMVPPTIAFASSGAAVERLLEAILGRSRAWIVNTYWPSASRTSTPFAWISVLWPPVSRVSDTNL
jgi:hypothetical protein